MKLERSEHDGLFIFSPAQVRNGGTRDIRRGAGVGGITTQVFEGEGCGAFEPAFAVEHESPASECSAQEILQRRTILSWLW
jgi:hypothetical protein